MQRILRVGVLSSAKISCALYGIMGLIFVPIFLIIGAAGLLTGQKEQAAVGAMTGLFLAIMMPLLYAGMGFVIGALSAVIYNLVAGWIGGIEIELAPVRSEAV